MKPTTSAFEADARLMSFSLIPPTPWWMTLTRTSGCWIFCSSETAASTEPCTSPLSTRFRSWTAPACSCVKSCSSDGPAFAAVASCSRRRRSPRTCATLARVALVLDDATELARGRRVVEPENLDGLARPRLLDLLPAEVVEGADPAPGVTGHDRIADLERAALDEHRRDRATPDVEPGLDDRP